MCRGGGSKLRLRSWFKFEGRILWMREEYNNNSDRRPRSVRPPLY